MFRNSIILFLICFCVHLQSNAQPSDFLSLHNKSDLTVKTFLPGSSIVFGDVSGQTTSGIIKKMMHDSLFVEQYDLRRAYDRWGFSVIDTVTRYTLKFHYKDIKLLKEVADLYSEKYRGYAEDVVICIAMRKELENRGIKFPKNYKIAAKFSCEIRHVDNEILSSDDSFGFHCDETHRDKMKHLENIQL